MHRILGGSAFKASYNFQEYSNAACSTAPVQDDLSNYWAPQLYFIDQDASNNTIYVPLNAGVRIYYNLIRNSANETVKPFPEGLRMLWGSPNNKAPDPRLTYQKYVCQNPGVGFSGNTQQDNFNFPTECKEGMKVTHRFPCCWDGINLYKSDGSHVAHTGPGESFAGACPISHPYRFPGIQLEMIWNTNSWAPGKPLAGKLAWSNGDTTGYGFHADFVNGWKTDVLAAALKHPQCVGGNFAAPVRMDTCPILAASYSESQGAACQPQYGVLQEPTGNQDYVPIRALPGCNPLWGSTGSKPTCNPPVAGLDVSQLTGTDGPYVAPVAQQVPFVLPTTPGWNYIGCAATQTTYFNNQSNYYDSNLTPERCQASCLASGLPFSAMGPLPGFSCFCGASLNSAATSLTDGCTSKCPGDNSATCGGSNLVSVYYAGPGTPSPAADYIGCYGSPPSTSAGLLGRSNYNFVSQTMTKQVCMQACVDRQSTWAFTTFNTYCYCGGGLYDRGAGIYRPDDFCNAPCKGNTSQSCGGQGMLSVYNLTATNLKSVDGSAGKLAGWQGCYNDAAYGSKALSSNVWMSSSMTPTICVDGCSELGYSIAAVQSGSRCMCGDVWNGGSVLPAGQCSTPCAGDGNSTCGGSSSIERFTTSFSNVTVASAAAARPTGYQGCYYTPSASDGLNNYTFTSTSLTVEICAAGCQQMGYRYAGVQAGNRCKCGSSAMTSGQWISSYCNTKCLGNSSETCGGAFYMEAYDATVWQSNSGPSSEIALGCFSDPSANGGGAPYSFTSSNNSRRLCRSACNEINYPLAIMTSGNKCSCSQTWTGGQQLPTSQCNIACPGNSTVTCGGSVAATLFNATGAVAPALPSESGYIGCFASPSNNMALKSYSYTSSDMTPEVCRKTCNSRGFSLAGLFQGGSCACDNLNSAAMRVPTVVCDRPCAGDSTQFCGSGNSIGIFNTTGAGTASNATLGCFSDSSTLPVYLYASSFMTNDICASQCAVAGYAYAGVMYGTTCRCGNSPTLTAATDSSCSTPCSGDSSTMCGASNRITLSKASSSSPVLGRPSVYLGVAGSLGCYKDQGTPKLLSAINYQSAAMTPTQCISNCNALGYTYAGLEESKRCYCDNAVNTTKSNFRTSMADCSGNCTGDANQKCGAGGIMQLYDIQSSGVPAAEPAAIAEGYQGCYALGTILTNNAYSYKGTVSASLCRRTCRNKGFTSAALYNSLQCTCTNDQTLYGAVQPPAACALPCNGNSSQICGAGNLVSVYDTVGPGSLPPPGSPGQYVGCYQDTDMNAKMSFKISSSSMTNQACAALCSSKGTSIWGTYQSTTCWCGLSLPATQVMDTSCARPCGGSASDTCGGSGALSVYSSLSFGNTAPASTSSTISTLSIASSTRSIASSFSSTASLRANTSSVASATTTVDPQSSTASTTSAANSSVLSSSTQAASPSASAPVSNATVAVVFGWTSGQCLVDTTAAHALNFTYATSNTLTAARCASLCQDYEFFGLKAGNSCFCSNAIINNATLSDSRCNSPCGGDISTLCGGEDALLLYRSNTVVAVSASSSIATSAPSSLATATASITATATRTVSSTASNSFAANSTVTTAPSSTSSVIGGAFIVTQSVTESSCNAASTTTVYVTVSAGAEAARTATPARRHRGFDIVDKRGRTWSHVRGRGHSAARVNRKIV